VAVIEGMVRRVLAGDTLTSIVAWLNDSQQPTQKGGGAWSKNVVRQILLNPQQAGFITEGTHPTWKVIGPGTWPANIDPDEWNRVVSALTTARVIVRSDGKPMRVGSKKRPSRRYLLTTGFATCGRCGTDLIAGYQTATGYGAYRCSSTNGGCNKLSIKAEWLEGDVTERVVHALAKSKRLRAAFGRTAVGDIKAKRAAIKAKRDAAELRLEEANDEYSAGRLTLKSMQRIEANVEAEVAGYDEELALLPSPDQRGYAELSALDWDSLVLAEKQEIFTQLQLRVIVNSGGIGAHGHDAKRVSVTALGVELPPA
jgi:hypothetical protein